MRYFSLFTGIGGLDMGLEEIGAECAGFSEIKESSIRIYLSHYPGRRNFGDITKINFEDLSDFDILTGGFPCQSFSMSGLRRGFEDRRGKMIFYINDLLRAKKPKFAVLENVKGILTHDEGVTYRNVFALLQSCGYYVRCVLLNSMNYGSAQSRERVIFLCCREDFLEKSPEVVDRSKRFRDVRDVWGPFKFVDEAVGDNDVKLQQRHLYPFNMVGGYDVVTTLTTGVSGGGGRNPSLQQKVIQEADGGFRFLTCLEAERLQSFPDGWTEGESVTSRWFALGNAVNCAMSRYLFRDYLKGVWW